MSTFHSSGKIKCDYQAYSDTYHQGKDMSDQGKQASAVWRKKFVRSIICHQTGGGALVGICVAFRVMFMLLSLLKVMTTLITSGVHPNVVLFSMIILFLYTNVLAPGRVLRKFDGGNVVAITLLFLMDRNVHRSNALKRIVGGLLPRNGASIFGTRLHVLPSITFVSTFLGGAPIIIVFTPVVGR